MALIRIAFVLAASVCAFVDAAAQEAADHYPSKPVTFIVPFAPGGTTGLIARLLGQKLEQRLGKPFVVEHRPGGGGETAGVADRRAAPRGCNNQKAPAPGHPDNGLGRHDPPCAP